ncbi:hypothetical protein predicted by Glimmer/Critica [Sorangium cellulosum So ce56]|uniref:PAC domain-containing protein n=1 Tax=Sorangium cellulosum (strain So ce56) TaxID=448385 RepID=A9G1W7_SORC5|nr:hypothetical protein [Sorangium cellulosum]CAN92553.1 hypothetical protein predicted by Glimmer/Critica [Sorangium cellulosum So ce56]
MDEASRENELTLATASGAERTWVFSSARLGRDAAGRRLLVTIACDITERKRAGDAWEATLREADHRKDAFLTMLAPGDGRAAGDAGRLRRDPRP